MVTSIKRQPASHETATVTPLLLTIPQVMQCMGLGRNKVYDLIQKEGLPVLRFGRAVRVSYVELQKWLERRGQSCVIS